MAQGSVPEMNGKEAQARPLAFWLEPGRRSLKSSAILAVVSALIWPLQAWLVAFAIGALLEGEMVYAGWVAAGFIALGVMRALLGLLAESLADKATERITDEARTQIVAAESQRAGDSPFGGAGSISTLANEKLNLLAPYIKRYAPARARVLIVPLVILALALSQSWAVAVIFVISGPLIPVFMALVGLAAREASERQMSEIGTLNDLLVERLSALVDIRLLGAADTVTDEFASKADDLRHRTMAVLRVAFLSSTVLELFAAIGVAMVAVYVGFSLLGALSFGAWGGILTPQAGIFLLLLAPEFYQPMRDLSAAWHDKASAEAIALELADWTSGQTASIIGQGGVAEPLQGAADVSLRNCVLPSGLQLDNIDIAAGESIALMGPSGAGKTSVLRLIAGLLAPASGTVQVAKQVLSADNADAWRTRIGWMPQTPHFLNASLKQNIMLGRSGDMDQALKDAAIDGVVTALPHGLNTRLGETGGGLSGGEARRLTLARAIHGAPDVILADEPTADIDAATAKLVIDGLVAQVKRGATLVVATHDAELAAHMDRIVRIGADT